MRQLDGFTASHYDPARWAELIREAGARYAVLTAKHHDGVALRDSEATDLTVVKRTPAGRELLAPYADALRAEGIKVGLYYSLIDWTDDNYPNFLRDDKRYEEDPERWGAAEIRAMLLDVGPREDGTICDEQLAILAELGRWTGKHAEAIYGTQRGLPAGHFHGPTALSPSRETLYLYVPHRPNGALAIKGLAGAVKRIRVVGREESDLEDPLELYREKRD